MGQLLLSKSGKILVLTRLISICNLVPLVSYMGIPKLPKLIKRQDAIKKSRKTGVLVD